MNERLPKPQQSPKEERDRVSQEIPHISENLRADIIKEFPSQSREGLNVARAENYLRELNLPIKRHFVFDNESAKQVKKAFESHGFDISDDNCGGFYNPELNFVVVIRHKDMEKVNGPEFTERHIVHELAHGSAQNAWYITPHRDIVTVRRSGFNIFNAQGGNFTADFNWGSFFEEGFAAILDGEYARKYFDKKSWESILEKLSGDFEVEVGGFGGTETKVKMPAWYLYNPLDGGLQVSTPSMAAAGLSYLCKINPSLRGALFEARKNVDGLRKVAQIINNISSGLYAKLQKLQYGEKDFAEGAQSIQNL